MICYTNALEGIHENMLAGFFVGWPNPPLPSAHLRILEGSYCAWLAIDTEQNCVVGFITAVSDGVISAYIPLLEVLPAYQSAGIGKLLVAHMLESLRDLYMVDLLCDESLQAYYGKLGLRKATGACLRNYDRQSCSLL